VRREVACQAREGIGQHGSEELNEADTEWMERRENERTGSFKKQGASNRDYNRRGATKSEKDEITRKERNERGGICRQTLNGGKGEKKNH